jgi:hypothetical protein
MAYNSTQGPSPMSTGLGAIAAFLQGRQQQQQYKDTQAEQAKQDAAQAAQAAAIQELERQRLAQSQQAEKFQEGLYAPGVFKPKVTVGKYQQGPMKGKPKRMYGANQYVPGTGGALWQQGYNTQQDDASRRALQQQQMLTSEANRAKIEAETKTIPGKAAAYEYGQRRPRVAGTRTGTGFDIGGVALPKGLKPEEAFAMLSPRTQQLIQQWRDAGIDPERQNFYLQTLPNVSPQDKALGTIAVSASGAPKPDKQTGTMLQPPPPGVTIDWQAGTKISNGMILVKGSDGNAYAWKRATLQDTLESQMPQK